MRCLRLVFPLYSCNDSEVENVACPLFQLLLVQSGRVPIVPTLHEEATQARAITTPGYGYIHVPSTLTKSAGCD